MARPSKIRRCTWSGSTPLDALWLRHTPIPSMQYIHASKKCEADEIGMSLEMAAKLNDVMPGSGGKSCLERYEYAKHAVCFGFDPDA